MKAKSRNGKIMMKNRYLLTLSSFIRAEASYFSVRVCARARITVRFSSSSSLSFRSFLSFQACGGKHSLLILRHSVFFLSFKSFCRLSFRWFRGRGTGEVRTVRPKLEETTAVRRDKERAAKWKRYIHPIIIVAGGRVLSAPIYVYIVCLLFRNANYTECKRKAC